MKTLYCAKDRNGKRIYKNLQVIAFCDDKVTPIYGWPSGGFLDPLDIKRGTFTIEVQR